MFGLTFIFGDCSVENRKLRKEEISRTLCDGEVALFKTLKGSFNSNLGAW